MKRISITAIVAALLALALCSCGGSSEPVDTDAMLSELTESGVFIDSFQPQDEVALSTIVKLDTSLFDQFTYAIGTGYTGEEYGAFHCASASDAKTLAEQLQQRVDSLKTSYESYNVDALPRLDNAIIKQQGEYVCIVVAEDYDGARAIVEKYFK